MASDERHQVDAASQGDREAIEWLLERHMPRLRAYVHLRMGPMLPRRETVSDDVQSTCRELFETLSDFEYRGEAAFKKWLYEATLHKIMEHKRRHGAAKRDVRRDVAAVGTPHADDEELFEPYATVCSPSRVAMDREDLARVEKAFAHLSEEQVKVVLFSRLIGMSHAEIAKELGRNEGAVRVLLHRALAQLAVHAPPG